MSRYKKYLSKSIHAHIHIHTKKTQKTKHDYFSLQTRSKNLWILLLRFGHNRFAVATLNIYDSHSSAIFASSGKVICFTELEGVRHRKLF